VEAPLMRRALAVLLLLLIPAVARAQGGPPLITDDPDTPGPAHWEINLAAQLERSAHGYRLDLPRIDANYGVGRRIQLKLEAPWVRGGENGEVRSGPGNAVAGVKYRFAGQEGQEIAWSIYPQVEFNLTHASVTKGLVDEGPQFLMPTEVTIEIHHLEVNGEVGRNFVSGAEDNWIYGLSTEAHAAARLELLAELHGEGHPGAPDVLIANVGARGKLTKQMVLLLAVGHGVHGLVDERPGLLVYTGLQFNLPGLYKFEAPPSTARRRVRQ
jgi:hypothetical protein